eukprot:scaffold77971_cov21-Tisochrysis_lutea.AAC.1
MDLKVSILAYSYTQHTHTHAGPAGAAHRCYSAAPAADGCLCTRPPDPASPGPQRVGRGGYRALLLEERRHHGRRRHRRH